MKKRILAMLLALALTFALTSVAFAAGPTSYPDVPADHWGHGDVMACSEAGLVQGFPDGSFGPEKQMTRAELVTILRRLAPNQTPGTTPVGPSDIRSELWYAPAVTWAASHGIMNSQTIDGVTYYRPDDLIDREDLALMIYRFAQLFKMTSVQPPQRIINFSDLDSLDDAYQTAIREMQRFDVIRGYPDGTFGPAGNATRAEIATMVNRFRNNYGAPPPGGGGTVQAALDTKAAIEEYAGRLGYVTTSFWNGGEGVIPIYSGGGFMSISTLVLSNKTYVLFLYYSNDSWSDTASFHYRVCPFGRPDEIVEQFFAGIPIDEVLGVLDKYAVPQLS